MASKTTATRSISPWSTASPAPEQVASPQVRHTAPPSRGGKLEARWRGGKPESSNRPASFWGNLRAQQKGKTARCPQSQRTCERTSEVRTGFSLSEFLLMMAMQGRSQDLTKSLHSMTHLLQAHLSVNHHHKTSCLSSPHSAQTVSSSPMAPSTSTAYCLYTSPQSLKARGHQSASVATQWSYSETVQSHSNQSTTPISNACLRLSLNSSSKLGLCHSTESMTLPVWTSPSLFQVSGSPDLARHSSRVESRPLGAGPTSISQSHPTLRLQPSSDSDEFTCLLSGAPAGTSTRSLLDPTPQTSGDDLGHNPTFQIHDSHSSLPGASSSPPALPGQPSDSSLDSGSPQMDVLAPRLTLGDPSASEHTSLECLLGNRDSVESRDSESMSSRRSSIGGQTQSTEQSWCLDLTD